MIVRQAKQTKRDRVASVIIPVESQWSPLTELSDQTSEEAVIGAVFQKPDLFPALSEIVQAGDFFYLKNAYIWYAFETLSNENVGIDIVTVSEKMEQLNKTSMWGEDLVRELARLIECAPDTSNAEHYAKAVFNGALRIRLMQQAEEVKGLALNKQLPIDDLICEADRLLYKATNRHIERPTDAKSIMGKYYDRVEEMVNKGAKAGLPTGFRCLDELTGGLFAGEVAILAGSEGMGKTTCALSKARNSLMAGKRVGIFTLEMNQEEIIRIFTAMETGIYKSVLKQFTLSQYQWKLFVDASGRIANWPLEIVDDFPQLTPVQLRRKLRTLTQRSNFDLVVIDGLWLMEASEPSRDGRPRDVGNIMRDLNQIARDFDVPLLITHQYNADINGKKHPTVYELSESAGVRRNSQVVWGLHRANYYDRDSTDDTTSLYILKDRNGVNTGAKVPLIYNTDYSRYEGGQYVS